MNPSYDIYSSGVLFVFLVLLVLFFLLFSLLSLLHFLSGEKGWAICGEIGGFFFAILFPLGDSLHDGRTLPPPSDALPLFADLSAFAEFSSL